MSDSLLELRERAGLASCAKRYEDVISIYKHHLLANRDVPPCDRSMLYDAYQKLILDEYFKSYWKLTSSGITSELALNYLETIENHIDHLSQEIVELIDSYFLAAKSNTDLDIVVALRQRADFLFFHSAIGRPATRQIMLQSALRSYTEGVERSRLTLPINEPERVLIHLRKCACDVHLSYGRCHPSIYAELIEAIEELKCTVSSSDDPLLVQMETYRKELVRY